MYCSTRWTDNQPVCSTTVSSAYQPIHLQYSLCTSSNGYDSYPYRISHLFTLSFITDDFWQTEQLYMARTDHHCESVVHPVLNHLTYMHAWCYTEKATPARHRPERQHNARSNRRKQRSPNETKPYSNPTPPRQRQTTPTNGHTPRRMKPMHTCMVYCTHAPLHDVDKLVFTMA